MLANRFFSLKNLKIGLLKINAKGKSHLPSSSDGASYLRKKSFKIPKEGKNYKEEKNRGKFSSRQNLVTHRILNEFYCSRILIGFRDLKCKFPFSRKIS